MPHPPNIPLTRQTDDRNFPVHDPGAPWGQSGHPYPKCINREFTEEDIEPWKRQHVQYDAGTRAEYFNARRPQPQRVLSSGKTVPGQLVPVLVTQEMIDAARYAGVHHGARNLLSTTPRRKRRQRVSLAKRLRQRA